MPSSVPGKRLCLLDNPMDQYRNLRLFPAESVCLVKAFPGCRRSSRIIIMHIGQRLTRPDIIPRLGAQYQPHGQVNLTFLGLPSAPEQQRAYTNLIASDALYISVRLCRNRFYMERLRQQAGVADCPESPPEPVQTPPFFPARRRLKQLPAASPGPALPPRLCPPQSASGCPRSYTAP